MSFFQLVRREMQGSLDRLVVMSGLGGASNAAILAAATVEIEAIIHKLRVRLMDHVRHSELLPLDEIGRAEIVAAITKETTILTQATNMVAFAGQGVVLVFFVAIYIAYLSLLAFALSAVIVCAAGVILHFKSREVAEGT